MYTGDKGGYIHSGWENNKGAIVRKVAKNVSFQVSEYVLKLTVTVKSEATAIYMEVFLDIYII